MDKRELTVFKNALTFKQEIHFHDSNDKNNQGLQLYKQEYLV